MFCAFVLFRVKRISLEVIIESLPPAAVDYAVVTLHI